MPVSFVLLYQLIEQIERDAGRTEIEVTDLFMILFISLLQGVFMEKSIDF